MAFIRYRPYPNGRTYASLVEDHRVPGKRTPRQRTLMSLGPVGGKKRKKNSDLDWDSRGGGAALGLLVILPMTLLSHGFRKLFDDTYDRGYRKDKPSSESGRDRSVRQQKLAEINRKYGIDMSSQKAFHQTRALLSQEQLKAHRTEQLRMLYGDRQKTTSPEVVREWAEFGKRIQQTQERKNPVEEEPVRKSPADRARDRYMEMREHHQSQIRSYWKTVEDQMDSDRAGNEQYAKEQAAAKEAISTSSDAANDANSENNGGKEGT